MGRCICFTFFSLIFTFNSFAQIKWAEHPVSLNNPYSNEVEFGYLQVPENRENPNSREIFMAFTRIRCTAIHKENDAVIFLPGGPGGGYNPRVNLWLNSENMQKVLEKRDIILVDPRGTEYSYPRLCDDINSHENYYNTNLLSGKEWEVKYKKMMQNCAATLKENNIDVHSYSSLEVASDLEELRKVLGYDQWNVQGHSYGSYYAFVLMQQYPESIRSAFISSISSIDLEYDHLEANTISTLYKVFEACERNPSCNEEFPDLEDQILDLMGKIEDSPIEIQLPDKTGQTLYNYSLGPSPMMAGLQSLMYSQKGLEILPAFIYALNTETDWIIKNMAPMLLRTDLLDRDMGIIVWSNDSDPNQPRPIADDNLERHKIYNPNWFQNEVESRNKAFEIIRTKDSLPEPTWKKLDIPTLMLSAEFDPATPPRNAQLMLKYLTNVKYHIVPAKGHDSYTFDFPEFFDKADPNIDISKLNEKKSLSFVTGVSLNRGVATTMSKVATGKFTELWLPVLSFILAVISFLFLSVNYTYLKIKKKEDINRGIKFWLWLLALGICFATILLGVATFDAISSNPFIAVIGLPKGWFVLKIGYAVLGILLIRVIAKGNKLWLPKLRILSAITLLAGIGFMAFILGNGFV